MYSKEQLEEMAAPYLRNSKEVFASTDGHFFRDEALAKAHASKRKIQYFPFGTKKQSKKTD